ncbi:hypothetical protein Dimus_026505 [Dionaea muscipula]
MAKSKKSSASDEPGSTQDVLPPDSKEVGEDEEKKEVIFLIGNSSLTAKELEKEIDEIIAQAIQHPFILESLITLDDLVQEHIEENPSDQSGGSNVDASNEKEDEEVEKDEDDEEVEGDGDDIAHREGKGAIMEEDEMDEDEVEEDSDVVDQLEIDIKVPFQQEKIEKKPAEWTEAYDAGVLTTIEEWGKEIEEMFQMPPTSEMSNLALQTLAAPEAPSTSDASLLLSSELNVPPSLTENLQDYENEVLGFMDLKEELYESQLRLSEADNTIHSLHFEMKNLEDRWMSKTRFLERKLDKIRATMISYAILEDTSTSSSDKKIEDPSSIVMEDPMSAIILYEPPPTFEEEDKESVGEFEISSSEDVDSLFND